MNIPNKLKVGGKVYEVLNNYIFQDRNDRCGQSEHDTCLIKITHLTTNGAVRPQQSIEETMMHEIIHCVDQIYNAGKLDEETVLRMSEGLYQVLKDNDLLK